MAVDEHAGRSSGSGRVEAAAVEKARDRLLDRIRTREAQVAVVGLGYVGLPLALAFARAHFPVIGVDIDREKIDAIRRKRSYLADVESSEVASVIEREHLRVSTEYEVLAGADTISICVPTPLGKSKDPDISYIVEVTNQICSHLRRGQLIVLESTTYPGTTEEVIRPKLEESGLAIGTDIWLAFSPERTDPGNPVYKVQNTPKVVGGITPDCAELACALYGAAIEHVVRVSSTRCAEMVKLLENTFRSVNIGLVNELAIMCDKLGIEVWEVIDAAATKPFGFMPFYPGPGLGGHCIPVDPHYLSWKLKTLNYTARFIELASEINSHMPEYVVTRIADVLNLQEKSVRGSRILAIGAAYKRNVGDVRESPAIDILRLLRAKGAEVQFHDPYVEVLPIDGEEPLRRAQLTAEAVAAADCVVLITDHSSYDYAWIVETSRLVFDTRNATAGIRSEKVHKL